MSEINKEIARKTGLRVQAVEKFLLDNNLDNLKLLTDLGHKKIQPIDLSTAISGKPGNKYAKLIIQRYLKESKIEILKRMIREEVRKTKLSEVTKYVVTWSDRDYKPHKKVFVDDPQGPAENGRLKAMKFMKSLEKKDAQSPYGLYRNIDLEWLSETKLKESTFSFDRIIPGKTRIEYIIPGQTSKTSTGLVIDKNSTRTEDFLIVLDDKSKKRMNIFMKNVSNIVESKLKESSFDNEVDELATNLIEYLGTELPATNWKTNPRIFNWFRDNEIKINTQIAQDIYRRALELNQDNKPKSRKYLDN